LGEKPPKLGVVHSPGVFGNTFSACHADVICSKYLCGNKLCRSWWARVVEEVSPWLEPRPKLPVRSYPAPSTAHPLLGSTGSRSAPRRFGGTTPHMGN
jgi:hypothetical protein